MTRAFAVLLTAVNLVLWPSSAQASICGEHKNIKKILGDRYQESQRAVGMVNQDGLIEVYTSSGGSWSILATSSKGRTCIIAAGKDWQEFEQAPVGPDT